VKNSLDVVPVGIEHERAVIVGVIVRAGVGRAVVLTTRGERGLVELGGPSASQKSGLGATP